MVVWHFDEIHGIEDMKPERRGAGRVRVKVGP